MKPQREHRSISWGRLLRQDNWVLTEFTPYGMKQLRFPPGYVRASWVQLNDEPPFVGVLLWNSHQYSQKYEGKGNDNQKENQVPARDDDTPERKDDYTQDQDNNHTQSQNNNNMEARNDNHTPAQNDNNTPAQHDKVVRELEAFMCLRTSHKIVQESLEFWEKRDSAEYMGLAQLEMDMFDVLASSSCRLRLTKVRSVSGSAASELEGC
ncbi:hypothetical protein PV05_09514 [Exophiala xenobiotica]|uniref:Uncharacterized protein n=1 Tax=Exophiala xenobiotica TaxID=348802 RepID=A0A0D2BES8_9EURO|nr:uncharacterized protein PV05_09514 [Exophiala xenobiotica]KIW50726.1 hypothetical protein PV05_09514 [Exophiala xenobiotica]